MHTNEVSQKPNLPAMTTGESDAGASMQLYFYSFFTYEYFDSFGHYAAC